MWFHKIDNDFQISGNLSHEEIIRTVTSKEPKKITDSEYDSRSYNEIPGFLKYLLKIKIGCNECF